MSEIVFTKFHITGFLMKNRAKFVAQTLFRNTQNKDTPVKIRII